MAERGGGLPVRRLDIRLGLPVGAGHPDYYPVVEFLVDGHELLAYAAAAHWLRSAVGFGAAPAEILGDEAVLLPSEPAQRVALYSEHSLSIAPLIAKVRGPAGINQSANDADVAPGDLVVWSDFRGVWYDRDEPVIPSGPMTDSWPLDIPDMAFGRAQYNAEVRRAVSERGWESDAWRTALLLDAFIRLSQWAPSEDLEVGGVVPQSMDSFLVTFWDVNLEHRFMVKLRPGPGTPRDRAKEMADYLLGHRPCRWPVVAGELPAGLRPAGDTD